MTDKQRFICYHIDDSGSRSVPIATGRTRDQAQSIGIVRTLASCELRGGIQVQDRTADVPEDIFIQITQFLNMHFMSLDRGVREGASCG